MQSRNFEFLRPEHGQLADLGGFAEHYVHSDPSSALVKLRLFGEQLTSAFYVHFGIPRPVKANFMDLLETDAFKDSVPSVVRTKLSVLRSFGNRAAHGTGPTDPENAGYALKEAFDLARWFGVTVQAKADIQSHSFEPIPTETEDSKGQLKREKKETLQRLAAQEAEMQRVLQELESTRAQAAAAEKNQEELAAILAQSNQAANALHFSEAETRKLLIDQLLVQAGWNISDKESVGIEVELDGQPTDTGIGYADYVLYDTDGKALAVIEAKKTAHHAEKGRKQAKLYADALEKKHGQRPVIFYTNGFDIWIWDDVKAEVPRKLFGFYSKDSLQYCLWRSQKSPQRLADLNPKEEIVNRIYQVEAIKRVCERFDAKRRKALLVQATGTGKTRVAIALSELLIRAGHAKRVLFLCDRRELRKQAHNAYKQFLEAEPRTYVTSKTNEDRNQTIYLATYPAMMKCFQNFDVGFFDLIIADESHRSIYNRYRDLFRYFDAYQVGLTATPVKKILRNTFQIFECEDGDPTSKYEFQEAISDTPPWLVPFRAVKHTTKFLRQGIRYAELTPEQQLQLEEQVADASEIDYSKESVSKEVFNKDTDRAILRNLMEHGIRNPDGTHVGKTIVFARNHEHAMQLQKLFEEMYPQYMKPRQEFCAVIDNYIDRAEQLIDDFKGESQNKNLYIAISVDMLDTGIDVPEVVNLVFAKPIKSYVKFWQMIGRGTRLRPGLFINPDTGAREDKSEFLIFDHWGNFEYFGENPPEVEPSNQKSLLQKLFEARLAIGELALEKQNLTSLNLAIGLLEQDVRALPENTIAVRDEWRNVKTVQQEGAIKKFDAEMVNTLRQRIAPLMQWRDADGYEEAYRFDLLVAKLQRAVLAKSAEIENLQASLIEDVELLPINLTQVVAKMEWINKVKSAGFWANATVESLDEVRRELRGIMHCRNKPTITRPRALEIDITDSDEQSERQIVKLEGLDLAAYRIRVESVLKSLFEEAPALQKIKAGQLVTEAELRQLIEKVMLREPDLKVDDLLVHFPNTGNRLDLAIRQVIGLDAHAVNAHFTRFVQKYPTLTSHQIRFLELIKKHIAQYGALQIEKLYETPFTQIHSQGVDGVFTDERQIDDLLTLIGEMNQLAPASQN
jgi:type I restriction enzyme R subunit